MRVSILGSVSFEGQLGRAGNEPSQRLKFHNDGEGPFYTMACLKVLTSDFKFKTHIKTLI